MKSVVLNFMLHNLRAITRILKYHWGKTRTVGSARKAFAMGDDFAPSTHFQFCNCKQELTGENEELNHDFCSLTHVKALEKYGLWL